MDKSEAALKIIFKEATSLEDKLDAYDLYVNLLHSQEKGEEAHMTCQDVLAQLGEKIPEFVTPAESKEIIEETVLLVSNLSEEKLLKLKEADEKSQLVMRFIILMIVISYFSKPEVSNLSVLWCPDIGRYSSLCDRFVATSISQSQGYEAYNGKWLV
jgi:hypothetical protein